MTAAAGIRPGDVVTVGNARWAVASVDGIRMELLRLNMPEAGPAAGPAPAPRASNVLDVDQAAAELGMPAKTVRRHLQTGLLKGQKVGSKWRILRSENPVLQAV